MTLRASDIFLLSQEAAFLRLEPEAGLNPTTDIFLVILLLIYLVAKVIVFLLGL